MKLSVIIPVYNQQDLIVRAIESVPEGCEIIVVDDGSTDNTTNAVLNCNGLIKLIRYGENKGVGHAVNKGIEAATGDYLVLLGSDDYFLPDFQRVIDQLDGTDLVYFNLQVNNGHIWVLDESTKIANCGSVKCMRRDFVGDTRCPEIRAEEDKAFYMKLLEKNPTEIFTGITAKHYNFPREGSLCDLKEKGQI